MTKVDHSVAFFGEPRRKPVDVHGGWYDASGDASKWLRDHGKKVHASELDINVADEALQADYLRDIMTVLYSHPAVEKITLWGFWEGQHWLPLAALWRTDWTIKPSGQAWLDLVFRDWRTNATLKTDDRGIVALRAFLGDYEVTAAYRGKTLTQQVPLPKDGTKIELKLPSSGIAEQR
jgi:endo-1,4-beta-xylanase